MISTRLARASLTASLLMSGCAATLLLSGCGEQRELEFRDVEVTELRRQISELEAELGNRAEAKATQSLTQSKAAGSTDVSAVGAAVPEATTFGRPHADEIVMSLESEILFKPGSATLSTNAKTVLAKVATVLKQQFPGDAVRVVGFTDDQKITRSKNAWEDNWDLSGGRSRAVLLYLKERGVEASRLSFAGFGDQKPVVPNSNDANRAKNRRVEIIVLPSSGSAEPAKPAAK